MGARVSPFAVERVVQQHSVDEDSDRTASGASGRVGGGRVHRQGPAQATGGDVVAVLVVGVCRVAVLDGEHPGHVIDRQVVEGDDAATGSNGQLVGGGRPRDGPADMQLRAVVPRV